MQALQLVHSLDQPFQVQANKKSLSNPIKVMAPTTTEVITAMEATAVTEVMGVILEMEEDIIQIMKVTTQSPQDMMKETGIGITRKLLSGALTGTISDIQKHTNY